MELNYLLVLLALGFFQDSVSHGMTLNMAEEF
jgi:hypothetical protein